MILASLLRLFYFLRVPQPAETYFVHLVMPLAASALFVCAIVFLGERCMLPGQFFALLLFLFHRRAAAFQLGICGGVLSAELAVLIVQLVIARGLFLPLFLQSG
jgi:hypothetical protein